MSVTRKHSSHLTVVGEGGFSIMHSSSTGNLYSAALPSSSLHADVLSSSTDCRAGETVLLGQQMKRCADAVVALRTLFIPDNPQGNWIISVLCCYFQFLFCFVICFGFVCFLELLLVRPALQERTICVCIKVLKEKIISLPYRDWCWWLVHL